MTEHFPVLIVIAPLFGALLCGLFGMRDHRVCLPIALAALGFSLACACGLLIRVADSGPVSYFVGGWKQPRGIGIELRADGINALVLVAIAVVSIIVAVYSHRRAEHDSVSKAPAFYVLFLLLTVGLFGITVTGDAFNLYVMVEVSSLTGYALIAMGSQPRGRFAAIQYIIMGTIGASFYLLGVGYLYLHTGALNMAQIQEILLASSTTAVPLVAFALIMVGLWIKMAFFPLGSWLPNAYTYSPNTTGSILAPLVTKVTVYIMIRIMLSVFTWQWIFQGTSWNQLVVWMSVVAILAGSVMALSQTDLKRMLCCLIIAEVGYMVGGAWLANRWGLVGSVYHILGDAFMTLTLFLAAGIFAKRARIYSIDRLDRMFRRQPLVMSGFAIGALGMIGLPPTCGFFSKWFLIRGGLESGHYEYVIALLISSLVNAVLFFRIFEIAYFGKKPSAGHDSGAHHEEAHDEHPLPHVRVDAHATDLIPLFAAASMVILTGLGSGWISGLIQRTLDEAGVPPAEVTLPGPSASKAP
ncbi:MAG: monovalent cation/H+ antiporter subunit D family protein [Verrucomicrobiales bacterium]